jgi:hypothetical protein
MQNLATTELGNVGLCDRCQHNPASKDKLRTLIIKTTRLSSRQAGRQLISESTAMLAHVWQCPQLADSPSGGGRPRGGGALGRPGTVGRQALGSRGGGLRSRLTRELGRGVKVPARWPLVVSGHKPLVGGERFKLARVWEALLRREGAKL